MYKRVTSLLLIAAVLLCLAACGSEAERTDTPNDDIGDIASTLAPAATPSPEATGAPEETAEPSPSRLSRRRLSRRHRLQLLPPKLPLLPCPLPKLLQSRKNLP